MASTRVVDPKGNEWRVRRKWVHRRLRWRGRGRRSIDLLDGAELASVAGELPVIGVILTAVALLLVAIAAVVFILPALIFVAELVVILGFVGLGLVGRVLFGRPWTVEARVPGAGGAYEWKTSGRRASRELVRSVADQLQATGMPTGGARVS